MCKQVGATCLNTEGCSPASASLGAGYGFHPPPTVLDAPGLQSLQQDRRRRLAKGLEHWGCLIGSLATAAHPVSLLPRRCPSGKQWVQEGSSSPSPMCFLGKRGPKAPGVLELRVHIALSAVWASQQSAKDMWAPVAAPPPSADGTRAPWEMSRLSHSLDPPWQHPALSLTGRGSDEGALQLALSIEARATLRTVYGAKLEAAARGSQHPLPSSLTNPLNTLGTPAPQGSCANV